MVATLKLDLREGLPADWKLEPGMLHMIDTRYPDLRNTLNGPSYVYRYHECECGRLFSFPWPLRVEITVFCKKCGKEFL